MTRDEPTVILSACRTAIGSFGGALKDFMAAVGKGQKPKVDGYEGRKSVEIILAIYKSSWSGRRVELPLASDPKIPKEIMKGKA